MRDGDGDECDRSHRLHLLQRPHVLHHLLPRPVLYPWETPLGDVCSPPSATLGDCWCWSCDNWWNTLDCLDYNNGTLYASYLDWLANPNATTDIAFANRTLRSPSDEYFQYTADPALPQAGLGDTRRRPCPRLDMHGRCFTRLLTGALG